MTTIFETNKDIHCQSCAKRVTAAIQSAQPGADVKVEIGSTRITVQPVDDAAAIIGAIAEAGYEARQTA